MKRSEKSKVLQRLTPSEEDEQAAVVEWLRWSKVEYFFHPANGGWRHPVTANRMKKLGVSAGCPDLWIVEPPGADKWTRTFRGDFHGVVIEMKRRQGGKVTADQERWLKGLSALGWVVLVCRGADEAIAQLKKLGY